MERLCAALQASEEGTRSKDHPGGGVLGLMGGGTLEPSTRPTRADDTYAHVLKTVRRTGVFLVTHHATDYFRVSELFPQIALQNISVFGFFFSLREELNEVNIKTCDTLIKRNARIARENERGFFYVVCFGEWTFNLKFIIDTSI